MNITTDKIREKVIHAVCISLAIQPDEVRDDSRLIDELGMDSLDFLDIMFSLEKDFNMKIRDADFDRILRPDKSEASLENEFLTHQEIAQLAPIMPALKDAAQNGKIMPKNILRVVTKKKTGFFQKTRFLRLRITRTAFCPPKANALFKKYSTLCSRTELGT